MEFGLHCWLCYVVIGLCQRKPGFSIHLESNLCVNIYFVLKWVRSDSARSLPLMALSARKRLWIHVSMLKLSEIKQCLKILCIVPKYQTSFCSQVNNAVCLSPLWSSGKFCKVVSSRFLPQKWHISHTSSLLLQNNWCCLCDLEPKGLPHLWSYMCPSSLMNH